MIVAWFGCSPSPAHPPSCFEVRRQRCNCLVVGVDIGIEKVVFSAGGFGSGGTAAEPLVELLVFGGPVLAVLVLVELLLVDFPFSLLDLVL